MDKSKPSRSKIKDWEQYYADNDTETMPWFTPNFDHDFDETLKKLELPSKQALDLGTGPGTQAIHLAKGGFEVTATDLSKSAVNKAKVRAKKEGVQINFVQDDITNSKLTGKFDLIIDRGCFHSLDLEKRETYAKTVARILGKNGILLLKCFSVKEPGTEGPHRLNPKMIRDVFEPYLTTVNISDTEFRSHRTPHPKALFSVLQKKS